VSNRRGVRRPGPPRDPHGDPTGLLLLGVLAVAWLGIPFLAMAVESATLAAAIVMAATWGPLFWLLAFRGARSDQEPGPGPRRRGRAMRWVSGAFLVISVVGIAVGNGGVWILSTLFGVGALCLARAWGGFASTA